MPRILAPLPDLQLDPRNTRTLLNAMQTKVFLESGGSLNDFSPASPLAAITEGQAYAAAELLYYLNSLPEAFAIQWMKLLGIQRVIGASAYAEITFVKFEAYTQAVVVPKGTALLSSSGLRFILTEDVIIDPIEGFATGLAISEKWGTIYNVPPGAINRVSGSIPGLESLFNADSAMGGEDLESVLEMKSRANALMGRRALISKGDFISEINTAFPEFTIVDIIDEDVTPSNVPILIGNNEGIRVSDAISSQVFTRIQSKTPIGINFSIIQLRTHPIYLRVAVEFNSRVVSISSLVSQVLEIAQETITPSAITDRFVSGNDVSLNLSYIEGITSINNIEMHILQYLEPYWKHMHGIEESCDQIFKAEHEDGICRRIPLNADTDTFFLQLDKYDSAKLYQLQITTIDENGTILIYDYDNLYQV